MDRTRVVVVSGRSLFVEGVASRLRQHLDRIDLRTVDSRQTDALEQITAAQPSTVILDATDAEVDDRFSLGALLQALPELRVIRLDPQRESVHLVTGEQRQADDVRDLIDLIELKP